MGSLYLVATPIGNLEDIAPRALRVLGDAELLLAEDTRRTRTLLDRHHVSAKPVSLHAHNEERRRETVLEVLGHGGDVAMVSDAGTPLVSDPGERIVRAAIDAVHAVLPVPGPSAVLAALTASGLASTAGFAFLGFPPRKAKERGEFLKAIAERRETLVFFESPRRVADTLADFGEGLGPRRACIARELTKLHEECVRGTLPELAEHFADGTRGEVTLVVEGARGPREAPGEEWIDLAIRARATAGGSASQIARDVAGVVGVSRSVLYPRVVQLLER